MSVARAAYRALAYAAVPAIVARLAWRSRAARGYAAHVGERFGLYREPGNAQPLIWIHAVSVGETHAAEPLVRALRERYADHRILVTHMTPTGRRAGERLYGDSVSRAY